MEGWGGGEPSSIWLLMRCVGGGRGGVGGMGALVVEECGRGKGDRAGGRGFSRARAYGLGSDEVGRGAAAVGDGVARVSLEV
jgi:hypothetical protein